METGRGLGGRSEVEDGAHAVRCEGEARKGDDAAPCGERTRPNAVPRCRLRRARRERIHGGIVGGRTARATEGRCVRSYDAARG